MKTTTSFTPSISVEQIYKWLSEISDPEIPVVTILDLGIVRNVEVDENGTTIYITPTYSGCPAMDIISMQIRMALISRGVKNLQIKEQLNPAWTTDWITEEAKLKMKKYGIAPPKGKAKIKNGLFEEEEVECPHCNSHHTELISQFGATSCKALYRCLDCQEPFEHFKCH